MIQVFKDIYFYIYKNKRNEIGKYSTKFKEKYKDNNYKAQKQIPRKKSYSYDIDENKKLIKRILATDLLSNNKYLRENIVVPTKYVKDLVNIYHVINGHNGYLNLAKDIIEAGYFIKSLYATRKNIINECIYCNQNRKNIFRKPSII